MERVLEFSQKTPEQVVLLDTCTFWFINRESSAFHERLF